MKKIKEISKKIYKSDRFSFFIFIIIVSFLHIFMKKINDDLFFSTVCNQTSLSNYLFIRYQSWTSRLVIEGFLVIFCEFLPMFIWKIVNIGMIYLLLYTISKLFIYKDKRKENLLLCISLICIPNMILREAGWMATMNNYLWVATTGLYSMLSLYKIINNEKISKLQNFTFIISTIYAANQEQMAGILFLIYSFFLVYIIKEKKLKAIFFINYLIIILSLFFIVTCPGNTIRSEQEKNTWYPEYSNLSLISKLEQGITSMMDYVIEDGRILFLALLILVPYIIWKNYNKICIKLLGLSPLIITLGYKELIKTLNYFEKIEFMQSDLFITFKCISYILILILLGISIYLIFNNKKDNYIKRFMPIFIYFTGFISRFIIAFSPTIYASGERTSYFWYISFCILIIIIIQNKEKIKE